MKNLETADYVKQLAKRNNFNVNPPKLGPSKVEIKDKMEKMASIIGFKNNRWCNIKSHQDKKHCNES